MQKTLLLLVILLLLPLSLWAAPSITTEILNYNFGEVSQGDKVSYTFRFRNSGDELLEISSVSSSCGCTAALLSSKRISPGEMGEIKATFDSSRFRGNVTKSITMKTNSKTHPQVQFKLTGIVKEMLGVSTTRVSWNWASADTVGTSKVVISNHSQQKILLQTPKSTNPQIIAELDQLELAPGKEAVLQISGSLAKDENRLNGYVLVATDFKPMPQLRISVSGRLSK